MERNEIIKTTDLLDLCQRGLEAGSEDPKVSQYANTLIFWVMCHLRDQYMVLTSRHVHMYNYLTAQLECL